ncbi:electron transfer flavoprotein regulatory factor 1 [Macrosteles quadrilineatus]|uniref:electron transfer flavoprotein regulatory factor 1 n=1 Tax=Macrosteles quadrilineatus TaxID=74068 RepID=UPI0023E21D34|nr:electron transfer flavoprotein regulatory factor 1 [Macrosteles quadrilineatus]XP_054264019.1 electron transfer flavoprotein regulatory factor 1 [Macrosteles quadrilineatus]XP_054264020.1 electron transfer flavoprotein regulatory factor 1 [Macrosteles quadrilineatus]XP_054264021.1 electron transfer flavoprotein regulatory factor 1 [Macrosteles quadrilineatus]
MSQKAQVIQLYKTLLYLGKDYPLGYDFFRTRLKRAFMKNRDEKDPEKIMKMIHHGEYVVRELETLYMLKKYRTLKRRYYNETLTSNKPPEPEKNT